MSCEHWTQDVGFAKASLYAACPWCEITRLKAALREVYEIWAGSDGMVPETAPEAYQERLIQQMRDAAARGLGMTGIPQTQPQLEKP